jgi:hypothetical protein
MSGKQLDSPDKMEVIARLQKHWDGLLKWLKKAQKG